MQSWLRCEISPGQFSDEYSVKGEMFNGKGFCLFAFKEDVVVDSSPTEKKAVSGWLRIIPLERKNDLVLVNLPQTTLENGRMITIKADQIKNKI